MSMNFGHLTFVKERVQINVNRRSSGGEADTLVWSSCNLCHRRSGHVACHSLGLPVACSPWGVTQTERGKRVGP